MEKADNVLVFMADFGWSDLGTWGSLYEHTPQTAERNAVIGGKVQLYDSHDCIVHLPKEKIAVVQKLDGYIVVEENNMLLICRKEDEQHIRHYVNEVREKNGEQFV